MKALGTLLILVILFSCGNENKKSDVHSDNRNEILGRNFSNSDILSIEIIEIEHPMLGGIIETIKIPDNKKDEFLTDFDNLNKKGMYKCGAKYVIRLNTENDTLRLKVCGTMVSNRMNDMYYELENEKSIIEDYLK